ncbi:thioredoxin family protein [Pedobacter sp. WC2423]|uniref:thioredoxin family protein n=1 Tax=Pedobacter sp. WC2423 TaxID=3234142 RepID=UPI003465DD1F
MSNYSNIFVNEGLTYSKYRDLIDSLLKSNKTTGEDHSEAMLHYSKMNVQRMSRVDKTGVLNEAFVQAIEKLEKNYQLLVISEGWCGDAAQIVPLFEKMVKFAPEKFALRFVLRDQNLPLIDAHLTHGGRAIPVLLLLDANGELISKWGPRPEVLQHLLGEWKNETSDMFELAERLHLWYAKDRTQTTQLELTALITNLEN